MYVVLWLDKARKWLSLASLENEEVVPNREGYIEWADEYPGSMGPGGTYQVEAFADLFSDRKLAGSAPVVVRRASPARSTKVDLHRRLARRRTPSRVKALISRLKSTRHGWSILLPAEAGTCLGKRIEVEVETPELSDEVIDLLAAILENLPRLAARAERAIADGGGAEQPDDGVRIDRPRIWIDPQTHGPGQWTMVVGVKGSDYAWHVEFTRARFREVWSGD
jgi:hypothetical protein